MSNPKILIVRCIDNKSERPLVQRNTENVDHPTLHLGVEGTGALDSPNKIPESIVVPASSRQWPFVEHVAERFGCDWLFVCTGSTFIHIDRLLSLVDNASDLACNDVMLEECGLLSIEAGVLVRREASEKLRKISDWEWKGRRIRASISAPYTLKIRTTPNLRFSDRTRICKDNNLISQLTDGSPISADLLREICGSNSSQKAILLTPGKIQRVDFLGNGLFRCLSNNDFGTYAERNGIVAMNYENRPTSYLIEKGGTLISPQSELREHIRETTRGLPKLIHFIWLGGEIPEWASKNIESWRISHADWKVRIWTDADYSDFVGLFHPSELDWFLRIPSAVIKSDLLRMAILRQIGGVYIDTDFVAYSNFLDGIPADIEFGYGEHPDGRPECALLLSVPNNQFFTWFIWKSWCYWQSLTEEARRSPDKKSVVWPMNGFAHRVRKIYGSNMYSDNRLFIKGRKWAEVRGKVISISHMFLHGGAGAFANHHYSNTWIK